MHNTVCPLLTSKCNYCEKQVTDIASMFVDVFVLLSRQSSVC